MTQLIQLITIMLFLYHLALLGHPRLITDPSNILSFFPSVVVSLCKAPAIHSDITEVASQSVTIRP